jgi:hypothetical protein
MEQPRGPGLGHVREGLGSRLGRWVLRGHPQAGPGDPTSSYGFCSNGRPIHGDPVLDTVPLYPPEYPGEGRRDGFMRGCEHAYQEETGKRTPDASYWPVRLCPLATPYGRFRRPGKRLGADRAPPTSDFLVTDMKKRPSQQGLFCKPTPGLEPGTPSLRVKCSTN